MNLTITNLSKTYKNGVRALDDINLDIPTGMFGLLGPNGAGKSSLMRTIATLQEPDTGTITLGNIDVLSDKIGLRQKLGYLPQEFGVYPKISAHELLHYFATLKGVSSKSDRNKLVDYVLEITNLTDVRKKAVSTYSGGMRQRFGIAQMLLNTPELIIVDEPTAGLDPVERKRFLNVLREIGSDNIVIFSTHIVEDVRELCTDMAIMNKGSIVLRDSPENARMLLDGQVWVTTIPSDDLEQMESQYQVISSNYNPDNTINVKVYATEQPGAQFSAAETLLEDSYFVALGEHLKEVAA